MFRALTGGAGPSHCEALGGPADSPCRNAVNPVVEWGGHRSPGKTGRVGRWVEWLELLKFDVFGTLWGEDAAVLPESTPVPDLGGGAKKGAQARWGILAGCAFFFAASPLPFLPGSKPLEDGGS
mmetsp:Transcript_93861/g.205463  ORF Transcript_93861/g.205463 Transcript_93861/m.205463 type:complete len:124 (-) Transcript_93861:503-874(-)